MTESFSRPRTNVIESSRGYSVEVLGRVGLRYSEGERSIDVDSEVLLGPEGMIVYPDSIRSWNPPHQSEVITLAKRDDVIANILAAFAFRGFAIVLEDGPPATAADIAKSFRSTKPFEILGLEESEHNS